mmetsp:Transcript_27222/g.84732  ORF Transcript_27222/g.84732 Transcript_27222/m.84732 type:complete len:223 (-) Transcript_27222:570-1238(-)
MLSLAPSTLPPRPPAPPSLRACAQLLRRRSSAGCCSLAKEQGVALHVVTRQVLECRCLLLPGRLRGRPAPRECRSCGLRPGECRDETLALRLRLVLFGASNPLPLLRRLRCTPCGRDGLRRVLRPGRPGLQLGLEFPDLLPQGRPELLQGRLLKDAPLGRPPHACHRKSQRQGVFEAEPRSHGRQRGQEFLRQGSLKRPLVGQQRGLLHKNLQGILVLSGLR